MIQLYILDILLFKKKIIDTTASRGYVEIYFGRLVTVENIVNRDNSKTVITGK